MFAIIELKIFFFVFKSSLRNFSKTSQLTILINGQTSNRSFWRKCETISFNPLIRIIYFRRLHLVAFLFKYYRVVLDQTAHLIDLKLIFWLEQRSFLFLNAFECPQKPFFASLEKYHHAIKLHFQVHLLLQISLYKYGNYSLTQ